MLTAKQEKFARAIVEGMNQADAYRSAYSCKNMSDNSIYVNASKLVADTKVALRIKELRDEVAKTSIMSAQKRQEWLTEVIQDPNIDINARLKASDQLNRMQGEYVQKVEAEVNSAVNISIELSDD